MTADAVGGVWTYALDLARGLAAHDVAVTLAVLGPPPPVESPRVSGVEIVRTGLPLDWMARDEGDVARAARAVAALSRHANVVHLNTPALAAFGDFDKPVIGVCHSCLATWWDAVRGGTFPEDFRWRTALLAGGYRGCRTLVAPSDSFAEATFRTYQIRPRVVHNGRAVVATASVQRERIVLTAGRLWDEGKNVADLEGAARLIDAPILAAGPLAGPDGASRTLRSVQPLGRLDEAQLRSWLGRSTVFASMAIYEPFGLSVLEAAQAGCALVLSDIPTFRELWDGAAIFVTPGRPARLAAVLQHLLDSPAIAAEWAAAAQRRARRYCVDAMTGAMLALYRTHARQAACA